MALFSKSFSYKEIVFQSKSKPTAELFCSLLKELCSISSSIKESPSGKLYTVAIKRPSGASKIMAYLGHEKNETSLRINFSNFDCDDCQSAFLRGAFLSGGSVTDPAKRYHLELTTSHYKVSRETCALLLDAGFSPKETARGGNSILYFKQSDMIEDFLTAIGAPVCAMGVMEAKVEKDLRNGVNRRVNCETANLTKVVDASMEQVAAIKKLQKQGRLKELPPKLRETAKLRLENPEATLQELAAMQTPPVSKSAMNHRMRKLVALADES